MPGPGAALTAACAPVALAYSLLSALAHALPHGPIPVAWAIPVTTGSQVLCIMWLSKHTGTYLRRLLHNPGYWRYGAWLYPFLLPVLAILAVLGDAAIRAAGLEPLPGEIQTLFLSADSFPMLAVLTGTACVIAPITEEILFRGFLYGGLRSHMKALPTGLLSALCFAAFHQDLSNFASIFCLGCVLAWLLESTGSLWPAIALHMVNNTVSSIAVLIGRTACRSTY